MDVQSGDIVFCYTDEDKKWVQEFDRVDPDRIDTGVDPDDPYSGMQIAILDFLEEAGRLCDWATEEDLIGCVGMLP